MLPLIIKFQAFIPKTLGKPLLSYFEGTSRFKLLNNKTEFVNKLRELDRKGFTWLPEPGSTFNSNFFATDNVEMYHHHSEHSTRLALEAEIDLQKVGKYFTKDEIFRHRMHNLVHGDSNNQHSGNSHRVKAYIKRIPFYTDMPRSSDKDMYIGVCSNIKTDRSEELPLTISIDNSKKKLNTCGANDATTIIVSASAGYPFIIASPNIDFELKIELYKNLTNECIDVKITGQHNQFPAYELIINERFAYVYDPSDYGHKGPNPHNLSKNRIFCLTHSIKLTEWEMKNMKMKMKYTHGW